MSRHFDKLMLSSIELFCLAVEQESFTATANVAGLTPAAVSRSIARLEVRLGVQLFVRTTRKISLTENGQAYYYTCRRAIEDIVETEYQIAAQQQHPSGTLRISLPTSYAHFRVLPLLAEFNIHYPDIKIDVHVSNQNVDFISENYDLVIRARAQKDSTFIARVLEDATMVVVASPLYLAKYGTPLSLANLSSHECIQFILPSNGQCVPWTFNVDEQPVMMMTQGRIHTSGDILASVTLAKHNAGLLQTYRFLVENDIKAGTLVEVLQPFAGISRPFSIIYPSNQHMPHRTRVLIDFLIKRIRDKHLV